MTELERRILSKVSQTVDAARLNGAIVYLDHDLKQAGQKVAVGDVVIDPPWDAYLVFVDFEPRVNWGHACSYLGVRSDGDEVKEYPAHMPPFLKPGESGFRLLFRGPEAPEWAVAGDSD